MPTHNEIELLHPLLAKVYTEAKAAYIAAHPGGLRPRLGETYRPANVQLAYHAQGRKPLAEINQLRHIAGLAPIGPVEAKRIITQALPGQSAHGFNPSRAFDVQLLKPTGEIDWTDSAYMQFAAYVKVAAEKLRVAVSQGAYWPKFKDYPHCELVGWQRM
ncbi:M15 family metallopeptidase domain-containing protein [Hymenobacter ruber]